MRSCLCVLSSVLTVASTANAGVLNCVLRSAGSKKAFGSHGDHGEQVAAVGQPIGNCEHYAHLLLPSHVSR